VRTRLRSLVRDPVTRARSLVREPVVRYLDRRLTEEMDAVLTALRSAESDTATRLSGRLDALEVNAEMLKAEVRTVNHNLEGVKALIEAVGEAVAPTAGFSAVPQRLAEMRERLNAVERRTRNPGSPRGSPSAADVPEVRDGGPPVNHVSPIDYVGFERRFRGDPVRVQEITRDRYLELLRDHGPVLDVGCGKGELVETLVGAGVAALGIDLDPAMVDEARERGLDVRVADLNAFLEEQPEGVFGAIISTQVVEHLEVDALVRFLELSVSRLRPGGLFVAETPNPTSLIVLGTHFILDPTHVRPIHPALMVYLCECAGFRSVELSFYEPARHYHLAMLSEEDGVPGAPQINAAFTHLNNVLFGPQDYAVVARTPG